MVYSFFDHLYIFLENSLFKSFAHFLFFFLLLLSYRNSLHILNTRPHQIHQRLPRWHSGKESACRCRRHRDVDSIPGSGRSSGEGNGNSLQYSPLENSRDRGAWWATVYIVAKSCTWLSRHVHFMLIRYITCKYFLLCCWLVFCFFLLSL